MNQTLRNILVIRTDRLGDVILTLPVCSTLRRALPGARIAMLVRNYVRPVIAGNRFVDDVVWEDDLHGSRRPFHEVRNEIREKRFDAVVVVRPTLRNALLAASAHVPMRVGTGYRWYSGLFTNRVYEHRKTAQRHELEFNLNLLSPLGVTADLSSPPQYGITVTEKARSDIRSILKSYGVVDQHRIVVLHPASGGSAREWAPDRFREVGLRLAKLDGVRVVVTGMPTEERTLRRVLERSCPPFLSLVGRLALGSLAALLERASLFIANSTGPLHLANALGTPVIGLYPPIRPMSAARWGPYGGTSVVLSGTGPDDCERCVRSGHCACMLSIQINQVMDDALLLLGSSPLPKGASAL